MTVKETTDKDIELGSPDKTIKPAETSETEKVKKKHVFLFKFADRIDALLIGAGSVAAIAQGVSMPLMSLIFGDLIEVFIKQSMGLLTKEEFDRQIIEKVLYFVILGVGVFLLAYTLTVSFQLSAERQAKRIREEYFAAILRQEVGWFDQNSAGQLTTRVTGDTQVVQDGLGEKFGLMLMNSSMFISGFFMAFFKGWKLSLVLLSVIPALGIAGGVLAKLLASSTEKGQVIYGKAGAVVEEGTFSCLMVIE